MKYSILPQDARFSPCRFLSHKLILYWGRTLFVFRFVYVSRVSFIFILVYWKLWLSQSCKKYIFIYRPRYLNSTWENDSYKAKRGYFTFFCLRTMASFFPLDSLTEWFVEHYKGRSSQQSHTWTSRVHHQNSSSPLVSGTVVSWIIIFPA